MILSMTGFGRTELQIGEIKINAEVKSLNSKGFDPTLRLPSYLKGKEIQLRNTIQSELKRGKIDFSIEIESPTQSTTKIKTEIVKDYIQQLKQISAQGTEIDFLKIAMKLPDSTEALEEEKSEKEVFKVLNKKVLPKLFEEIIEYRKNEGAILEKEFNSYIKSILDLLSSVETFEKERIETVRKRIEESSKNIKEVDESRLEQEIVYYIEKLDISEEKSRLKSNCDYFLEVMNTEAPNGKKLHFVGQEIGREINTLGAKSNHAEIQKIVVQMKDELEKIKEQLGNVL